MARKKITYAGLIKMAKEYQVDKNLLFQSAAKTYAIQMQTIEFQSTHPVWGATNRPESSACRRIFQSMQTIEKIQEQIADMDDLQTAKTYVKGRENVSVSDLVKELPKQCDSANKTLDKMLDIIDKLGTKPQVKGKLERFLLDDNADA